MRDRHQSPLSTLVRADTESQAFEATAEFVAERLRSSATILTVDSGEGLVERATATPAGRPDATTGPVDDASLRHAVPVGGMDVLDEPDRRRGATDHPPVTQNEAATIVVPFGGRHVLVASSPRCGSFDDADRTLASTAVEFLTATREARGPADLAPRVESVLGHDLKSPLTVARGQLELARETGDTDPLDAVATALERVEELADGLVHVARTGLPRADHEEVDLRHAAERAWTVVESGRASMIVEASRSVVADRNRLSQLLENCFRNAVEHGGPGVTITLGPTPTGFFVEDDGVGIPEAARAAVLGRGYTTAADHDGLGLAVVATIAEEHGWTVAVGAGAEGGARIEVTTDLRSAGS